MSKLAFPIETERLLIRPAGPEDAPGLHAVLSEPTPFPYPGDDAPRSIDDARALVERRAEEQRARGFSMWAVAEKVTGRVVGECGLRVVEGGPDVALLCRMALDVRGRGYASEAARACVEAAFAALGVERIVGHTHPENVAARRVLMNAGMILHGSSRHYGGATVLYAVNRPSAEAPAALAE